MANFTPCQVAFIFPIENRASPGSENGRNIHKKAIKALAIKSVLATFGSGREHMKRTKQAIPKAKKAVFKLWLKAMARTRKNADITLPLGST